MKEKDIHCNETSSNLRSFAICAAGVFIGTGVCTKLYLPLAAVAPEAGLLKLSFTRRETLLTIFLFQVSENHLLCLV